LDGARFKKAHDFIDIRTMREIRACVHRRNEAEPPDPLMAARLFQRS